MRRSRRSARAASRATSRAPSGATISSSRCPRTLCSGLLISWAMPGDELAERGELLRLREPRAERLPFGFEPGLPRDVPGHEDRADGLAVLVDERRHRHDEAAAEAGMVERADPLGGRFAVGRAGPVRQVRSDELGERAFLQGSARGRPSRIANASFICTTRCAPSVTTTRSSERVERVLEQTPLVQHVLEELDVLDAGRELPPEVCRKIEPLRGRSARRRRRLRRRACRGRGASRAGA